MVFTARILAPLAIVSLLLPAGAAVERELSFEQDIRPIFKTHCFHCHGEGEKLKGGLDVRLKRFLMKESEAGQPVVAPGTRRRASCWRS